MLCNQVQTNYISPIGFHRHKCDNCKCIWEHSNKMSDNKKAHKCPKCGKEQWYKYLGTTKPCFYIEQANSFLMR